MKPGYKQTEIGVFPQDWNVFKLGEQASFRTGPFGSALHKSDYADDGVPIINPMHIIESRLIPTRTMTVAPNAAKHLADFMLRRGDIIIGRRGEMGRCAVVQKEQEGWLCGTGSMIVRCNKQTVPEYLQIVLSSPKVVSTLEDTSVGSTMINLNQGVLAGLKVQFPPYFEQRAIAEALSDVDALINGQEKLITKKRAIKQAAMQQYLTGQTRLSGEWKVKSGYKQTEVGMIPEDWEVKSLENIGNFGKGIGLLKEDIKSSGSTPAIPYTSLYTDFSEIINYNHIKWFVDDTMQTYIVSEPCLLIASSSNMAANTGKVCALTGTMPVAIGREVIIFKTSLDCRYISYLLSTPLYRRKTLSLARGTTIKHLYPATFLNYKIGLPPASEQHAIAEMLSDMDAEIATLEQQRDKTRALKQGMMQELLTGRVRLV